MMRFLLIVILFISIKHAYGQNQHVIDSMMSLIRNDESRNDMMIFYDLGFEYARPDHSRSLEYFRKGLPIAEKLGDSLMSVKFSRMIGHILQYDGKQVEAIATLERVLSKAKRLGYKREVGLILEIAAITCTFMARYDKALSYNFRALELWREENNYREIVNALINIGVVHYKVENYDKAVEYYQQALLIADPRPELSTPKQISYLNIGMAHVSKGDLNEAKRWILKSREMCASNCANIVLVASEYGLGYVAMHAKDYALAKQHFQRSLEISVQTEDHRFEAENLVVMGKIYRLEKNYRTAQRLLENALAVCEKGDYRNLLADAYQQLFETSKETGDRKLASEYLEKYVALGDSIHSAKVKNRIMVAQTEFEERENKLLLEQKEELLKRQRIQTQLVIVICLFAIAIAIGLFVLLRRKRRNNLLLDQRVAERTRELEENKVALERAYHEQNELLAKASQSIKSTIASQRGLNTSIVVQSGEIDSVHARKLEEELNHVAESLAKARSVQISTIEKT